MIQKLTPYEHYLYKHLVENDRELVRKKVRSSIEYAMAFMKPEVLQKIIQAREREEELEDNSEIFEKQVADTFGKPLQSSG